MIANMSKSKEFVSLWREVEFRNTVGRKSFTKTSHL